MAKIIKQANYKKGTIAQSKEEIIKILEASDEIEVKSQIIYDDDTQGVSLLVHYKPENVKR